MDDIPVRFAFGGNRLALTGRNDGDRGRRGCFRRGRMAFADRDALAGPNAAGFGGFFGGGSAAARLRGGDGRALALLRFAVHLCVSQLWGTPSSRFFASTRSQIGRASCRERV